MFRSSMRSSSGSSLFISLSKLLILKTIKIFKKYYQSIVVMWQRMISMPLMRTVWRRELSNRPWTSLFDIYPPDPWHAPVAATTVFSTPDDGRRKRPIHVG